MRRRTVSCILVVCALGAAALAQDRPTRESALPKEASWKAVTLLVRLYGFDIDDVPEGGGGGRRGSLGNVKRRAEKLLVERGGETSARTEVLPMFRLRGLIPR